jgi:glycine/serine hydroxymethyltransferase
MTKLTVFVKDCNGKILLTSAEGISREKDYEMSYNEALRNALRTMPKIDYKYLGQPTNQNTISNFPEQTINQNSKLVAEKTENGFLIIDNSTSKIVLKLYKTSIENVYIVQTGNKNGIAFKQNGKLIFEFIENGKASRDEFDVTF